MFSRIKDFVYRHRRKFFIGTAVVGGIALLSRYAEHKLLAWHDTQTRMLLQKQKKKQHYENTERTANTTVMSLAGSLKELVTKDLDSEALLLAIREQPQHKHSIWQQLKVIGFSRAISVVYVSSLVASAVRVQLMLLGGYTFGDLVFEGHAGMPISQGLQQKYLAMVHFLIEEGVPKLTQHVTRAVTKIVSGLPLTQQLTLSQLEALFQEIRLLLAGEGNSHNEFPESKSCKLENWTNYVLEVPLPPESDSSESRILYNMLIETCDILGSEDFQTVMDSLIQHGFNHLLDRMADFYPLNKPQQSSSNSTYNWVNNINREEPLSVAGDNSSAMKSHPPQGAFLSNHTLPVAKLVPVLSGVVHGALSPAPGQLLQKILMEEKLETLGFNVYDAFAVPLSK
ncbi:peroxisomal biogenesis factor 3 [Palaemon carinicauda]|uniref:peroxisomal biogenesis factor 3 n=1 Tax=Palaemon carinicauda TaxID=392227 RepID=UPI0035B61092